MVQRIYWKVGLVGLAILAGGLIIDGVKSSDVDACNQPILFGDNPHVGINCAQAHAVQNIGLAIFWVGLVVVLGTVAVRVWKGPARRPKHGPSGYARDGGYG